MTINVSSLLNCISVCHYKCILNIFFNKHINVFLSKTSITLQKRYNVTWLSTLWFLKGKEVYLILAKKISNILEWSQN